MSLKIIQNGTPVEATKIWIGGEIQAECLRVWSTEANAWVYEALAEVTGTLPLAFRSNGTALLDYRIDGNTVETTVKTANLVPLTTQKTATGSGITVTIDSSGVWHVTGTASQDVNILFDLEEAFTVPTALDNGGEGVIQFFNSVAMDDGSGYETARVLFYYGNFQRDYMGLHVQNRSITQYSDLANMSINRLGIWVKQGVTCDFTLSPMVVDDGIVHNEYVPPEITEVQGVGVRTENLFDVEDTMLEQSNWISNPSAGGPVYFINYKLSELQVQILKQRPCTCSVFENFSEGYTPRLLVCAICPRLTSTISNDYRILTNNGVKYTRTFDFSSWGNIYLVIGYGNGFSDAATKQLKIDELFTNWLISIVPGSTAPDSYIPYGYKMQMVSRSGTRRAETPIYIGDTQLMQDEYVSYGEQKIVRKLAKRELTGAETLTSFTNGLDGAKLANYHLAALDMTDVVNYNASMAQIPYPTYISNEFKMKTSRLSSWTNTYAGEISANTIGNNFYNRGIVFGTTLQTANEWKAFLAERYASGNPVTIWYILATPIKEDPPVPLPELPTFSDTNTVLDYEETPAPEEAWVKYHKK